MLVTKRSTNLKKELETYSWKKDKDGQTTNIPEDINNHAIDATRYLALMKLGKKPKPSFKIYASSM
jgi:phage terminase large subunit